MMTRPETVMLSLETSPGIDIDLDPCHAVENEDIFPRMATRGARSQIARSRMTTAPEKGLGAGPGAGGRGASHPEAVTTTEPSLVSQIHHDT